MANLIERIESDLGEDSEAYREIVAVLRADAALATAPPRSRGARMREFNRAYARVVELHAKLVKKLQPLLDRAEVTKALEQRLDIDADQLH